MSVSKMTVIVEGEEGNWLGYWFKLATLDVHMYSVR